MQKNYNISKSIEAIEKIIQEPSEGLPEEVFLFASRITPMINVDLLIKNDKNQTLLTWRDDNYYSHGWHVPGGIIRYKEKLSNRIRAVAKCELGTDVEYNPVPLAINEFVHDSRKNRGHFISILYRCKILNQPNEGLRCRGVVPKKNDWKWHDHCPVNIISEHDVYKDYI